MPLGPNISSICCYIIIDMCTDDNSHDNIYLTTLFHDTSKFYNFQKLGIAEPGNNIAMKVKRLINTFTYQIQVQ